ncbi:type VI secretion system-associated FHA domain protein TagH [Paracoccus sp. DMF-8]|uniref:type VI secretion system-associated FHA domain protein TagH n=1 Tax=Paracoccus sp. DMF-8 TaxID=3019445 RepID=UPI0023E86A8B|nr:type VI secretion system-associated FHA domain protein TagH [Paracoccus sp. DMF-8]MDF3605036.1 type VI secretion system-associated FHA domain protein TagH [Paracoccus sp. DMF-8]
MALTLLIENYQVLDDGGPASINVPETGLQVGRRAGMGWVLPDASRHISGHHFDVYFQGGDWWLRDMSTNGTFLHGLRHRLDGPHRLEHGDRFQVGQYTIVALMDAPMMVGGMNPASLPSHDGPVFPQERNDDPQALDGGAGLLPVDPLPREAAPHQPDFAQDFMAFPRHDAAPAPAAPSPQQMTEGSGSPFAAPNAPSGGQSAPAQPQNHPAQGHPTQAAPSQQPQTIGPGTQPAPATGAAPLATPPGQGADFIRAFCEGAGIPPEMAQGAAPEVLGHALGQAMRSAVGEIMLALRDRASAKQFVKVGTRTMRAATDNNPMKFLPDPDQALEAMFLRPRAGFLNGADSFDEALRDLRQHQAALFAALQPALMKLVGDLVPDAIESETDGGRFGSNRKARAWDSYVQRWDAKVAPHENGILDEFITHFASAYRDALAASAPKRG